MEAAVVVVVAAAVVVVVEDAVVVTEGTVEVVGVDVEVVEEIVQDRVTGHVLMRLVATTTLAGGMPATSVTLPNLKV